MVKAAKKQKIQKCIEPAKGALLERLYKDDLTKREENQFVRHYRLCNFCKDAEEKLYYEVNTGLNRTVMGHPSVPRVLIQRSVRSVLLEDVEQANVLRIN